MMVLVHNVAQIHFNMGNKLRFVFCFVFLYLCYKSQFLTALQNPQKKKEWNKTVWNMGHMTEQ